MKNCIYEPVFGLFLLFNFQIDSALTFSSRLLIQVSQVQKLMKLKELSLPTVAEELRQQSFWRSFLSSKTYVLTPLTS